MNLKLAYFINWILPGRKTLQVAPPTGVDGQASVAGPLINRSQFSEYKILLDVPAENPALDFEEYAQAFAEIITSSDARFAIGIFGGWGSGKTTLMRLIEPKLDPANTICVQFAAWRYEKEQHLIIPLLDTVREAVVAWSERNQAAGRIAVRTAATIGNVIHALLSGITMKGSIPLLADVEMDFGKALEKAEKIDSTARAARLPRSFYHGSFRELEAAFASFVGKPSGRRIVVFVDDLDRCLPEGALAVLESMKLFFDLDGFVFVVGLDRQVIEAAIDSKYGHSGPQGDGGKPAYQIRGAEYIKKIFQVPFSLYPISVTELNEFLSSIHRTANLPPDQWDEIRSTVLPHLRFIVGESGVNPREVKRYINAYVMVRKLKPNLDANVCLALQTIDFRPDWSTLRDNLYAYRNIFINTLNETVTVDPGRLANLDPRLRALPVDFVNYVRPLGPGGPPGPANRLLNIANIDEYLYAGEATRSSSGRGVMELIRMVGALRPDFRRLAGIPNQPLEDELRGNLESLVSSARSLIGDRAGPNTPLGSIERLSTDLRTSLESIKTIAGDPDGRDSWGRRNEQLISDTISELARWSLLA